MFTDDYCHSLHAYDLADVTGVKWTSFVERLKYLMNVMWVAAKNKIITRSVVCVNYNVSNRLAL